MEFGKLKKSTSIRPTSSTHFVPQWYHGKICWCCWQNRRTQRKTYKYMRKTNANSMQRGPGAKGKLKGDPLAVKQQENSNIGGRRCTRLENSLSHG